MTNNIKPLPEEPNANYHAKWQQVICKEFANEQETGMVHDKQKSYAP